MDVMHCRDSKSKNYGMAGTLSVYLFIVSAILCFIVYRMTNDSDPDGSKAAAKRAAKEARRKKKVKSKSLFTPKKQRLKRLIKLKLRNFHRLVLRMAIKQQLNTETIIRLFLSTQITTLKKYSINLKINL